MAQWRKALELRGRSSGIPGSWLQSSPDLAVTAHILGSELVDERPLAPAVNLRHSVSQIN